MHLNAADRYDNHMRAFVRSCPHLRMTVPLELSQGRSREGNGHLRFGVLGMSVGHVEGEGGRGVAPARAHGVCEGIRAPPSARPVMREHDATCLRRGIGV